jgi:AcrR family transcriptional regulator
MAARPPLPSASATTPTSFAAERPDNTRQRLISATADLVARDGIAAASARAIATDAGASPSAINYNFGNIERLLQSTFALGVDETREWLELRRAEIALLPGSPDGAAWALLHGLRTWTAEGRRLALLYQEALAAGAGAGPAADWTRLFRDFWLDIAERFGLAPIDGRLMHVFFESEALYHLSTWSPALEDAALADTVEHLAHVWLGAPLRPWRGALWHAEEASGTRPHGSAPPAAMRIAKAAAEVVEDKGLAGLTHRAVAHRAGVTTGSVTHHFRSIEDLVAGVIRGQVQVLTEEAMASAPPPIDEILTPERLFEALRFHSAGERPASPVIRRRRLFLASARRRELAAAGAVIRYSHGGTVRDSLSRIFKLSEGDARLYSGVLSRLLSAIWFASAGDEDPRATRHALMDRIEATLMARLTRL